MGWLARRLGVFVPIGVAFVASGAAAHDPERDRVPTLSVTGEARLQRPADELRMTIAVVSEGKSAADATEVNSRTMRSVLAALTDAGLTQAEVETGRFSVRPTYSTRPKGAGRDWAPRIVGYRVENAIRVETTKLGSTGELIEASVAAGANSIESISFGLADERAHRAEAIREATANARADAQALAEAAGVELQRALSVQLDGASLPPVPVPMEGQALMAASARGVAPPIEPGQVTVSARVTLVYEIAGAD